MFNKFPKEDLKIILKEGIILLVLFAVLFCLYLKETPKQTKVETPQNVVIKTDPFKNLELEAKAVYVYDVKSAKPIFSQNENEALPLASLAKVMTAIVATEELPQNTITTIGKESLEKDGDCRLLLYEHWRLPDLLRFSLIVSSNDGVAAIAYAANNPGGEIPDSKIPSAFIGKKNNAAKRIGMKNATFYNESGLDISEFKNGAYASAKDIATLFEYALLKHNSLFEGTSQKRGEMTSLDNINHSAENTNSIVGKIPGLIASKTGFTDLAGGNLAVVANIGLKRPLVFVVLGSSKEGRFSDTKKLTTAALNYYAYLNK